MDQQSLLEHLSLPAGFELGLGTLELSTGHQKHWTAGVLAVPNPMAQTQGLLVRRPENSAG